MTTRDHFGRPRSPVKQAAMSEQVSNTEYLTSVAVSPALWVVACRWATTQRGSATGRAVHESRPEARARGKRGARALTRGRTRIDGEDQDAALGTDTRRGSLQMGVNVGTNRSAAARERHQNCRNGVIRSRLHYLIRQTMKRRPGGWGLGVDLEASLKLALD